MQTIQTAPKDGTKIFIWHPLWDCAPIAWWEFNQDANCWGWEYDDSLYLGGYDEGWLGYDDDPMPTHWWPVPQTESEQR